MDRVPMTPSGYEKLRSELTHLKSVERPQNITDIETALAHGDLSENAEYHAAKDKQGQISAQIKNLESKIGRAEIIDPKTVVGVSKVTFGATVKLYDIDLEQDLSYKIVGDDETNIKEKKIGISSPIARALIGKEEGDEVKVKTPKGIRELEVIGVEYI